MSARSFVQIGSLKQDRVDPRAYFRRCCTFFSRLSQSDAVIVNIDYPLGMAAITCCHDSQ